MDTSKAPGRGAAASRRVAARRLEESVHHILCAAGLRPEQAAVSARLMVAADTRGAHGDGVFRLPQYVRRIESDDIQPARHLGLGTGHLTGSQYPARQTSQPDLLRQERFPARQIPATGRAHTCHLSVAGAPAPGRCSTPTKTPN